MNSESLECRTVVYSTDRPARIHYSPFTIRYAFDFFARQDFHPIQKIAGRKAVPPFQLTLLHLQPRPLAAGHKESPVISRQRPGLKRAWLACNRPGCGPNVKVLAAKSRISARPGT